MREARRSFWEHAEELQRALIQCGWVVLAASVLSFFFHKSLLRFVLAPLPQENLFLFNPLEGFLAAAKLSLWMGVVLSSPIWILKILNFLLPALRRRERKFLIPFFILSILFMGTGIVFAYKITLPFAIHFFERFNAGLGENLWSLQQTLNFALSLIFAHALVFELYVILLFSIQFNLCRYPLLKKVRRGVIVAIFVLAAILTPPDVLSQLLLALPMIFLYEAALLYARFKSRFV